MNEEVKGTPFRVIGEDGKGYRMILGKHAVSEIRKTPDEAIKELEIDTWNIIARVAGVVYEAQRELEINQIAKKVEETYSEGKRQGEILKAQ